MLKLWSLGLRLVSFPFLFISGLFYLGFWLCNSTAGLSALGCQLSQHQLVSAKTVLDIQEE